MREQYSVPLSQLQKPSHNYENEVNYAAAMDIQQLLVTISTSALTSLYQHFETSTQKMIQKNLSFTLTDENFSTSQSFDSIF